MNKLVEWMADPLNSVKVNDLDRTSETKVGDIHQEIATFVNSHCDADWTKEDAWVYLQYITRKYNQAADLSNLTVTGDTEKTKLRDDILYICPYYDNLKKVYARRIVKCSDDATDGKPTRSLPIALIEGIL
jgi:hypothetical protein